MGAASILRFCPIWKFSRIRVRQRISALEAVLSHTSAHSLPSIGFIPTTAESCLSATPQPDCDEFWKQPIATRRYLTVASLRT